MNLELAPKVFISCPINKVKSYCLDDYFNYVLKLQYPNKQYYYVDNSKDESFTEKTRLKHGLDIDWVDPQQHSNTEYMCASMNRCRKVFLDSDCDYWLVLECDIFPPLDVIQHLLGLNKDVVALPYMTGEGEQQFIINTEIEPHFGDLIRHVAGWEGYIKHNGKLSKNDFVGWGCTLLRRNIVEDNVFYISNRQKVHADTFFYLNLNDDGVDVFRDNNIICTHKNMSWKYVTDYHR